MRPESPELSFIDLFCGCGGNSWGMRQANGARKLVPLLALDADSHAIENYSYNLPDVKVIQEDIRVIKPDDILQCIGLSPGELGCIVASPPCQTYSRNNRGFKDEKDHRHTLYKPLLNFIEVIKPWVVLVENVPEMETFSNGKYHFDFLKRLKKSGYVVRHWIINSANYGVPQHRFRLIYLAYRKEMQKIPKCPPLTHGEEPSLLPWITVEDAIKDLPTREAGDNRDYFRITKTQLLRRTQYAKARCFNGLKTVFNHSARSLNDTQLKRLYALKEGQAYKDLPGELKPKKGYDASYGRLGRNKPAPTLTAWLSYPGSGRFSHYEQHRVITIREALRLQSFDDHFRVFGSLLKQSALVGNAVPPLLANAFKNQIVNDLEHYFIVSPQSDTSSDTQSVLAQHNAPRN